MKYDRMTHIEEAETAAITLRSEIIPNIKECLERRFHSFTEDDSIYSRMWWLDPANWREDNSELEAIGFLEEHFSDTLEFNGYDKSCTKSEWKDLK